MRFLGQKAILVGGVLVSLFMAGIFVSCHSITMAHASAAGSSIALPITQSLNEPCCMVQNANYGLHSQPLATISSTAPSLSNAIGVNSSPIWFRGAIQQDVGDGSGSYFANAAEVPRYSYLKIFIAQGLLQPKIYTPAMASV